MSWEYFNAEEHGLRGVGNVDWLRGEGSYEWDETSVFYRPEDGLFYWEHGSGCSCDGPLEYVHGLDDLTSGNLQALSQELTATYVDQTSRPWGSADKDGVLALEVTRVIEAAVRVEGTHG